MHEIKISDLKITTTPIKILSSMPGVAGGEEEVVAVEAEVAVQEEVAASVSPSLMELAGMASLGGLKSQPVKDPSSRLTNAKRVDTYHHAKHLYVRVLQDAHTPDLAGYGTQKNA